MATASEVKAGLDDIAAVIREKRTVMAGCKAKAGVVSTDLDGLATAYADVVNTIGGYSDQTTDAFEQVSKAELAKLTTEFLALKGVSDAVAAIDLG